MANEAANTINPILTTIEESTSEGKESELQGADQNVDKTQTVLVEISEKVIPTGNVT